MLGSMLQITSSCSAGCIHCPYAVQTHENTEMSLEDVARNVAGERFVLVTGGEPLEHRNWCGVLRELNKVRCMFRIATGGHIPLLPFIDDLKESALFTGFSVGTDVISQRSSCDSFVAIWKNNIELLNSKRVPYSLTPTVDQTFDVDFVLRTSLAAKAQPGFLMLAELEGQPLEDRKHVIKKLCEAFVGIEVKFGFQN